MEKPKEILELEAQLGVEINSFGKSGDTIISVIIEGMKIEDISVLKQLKDLQQLTLISAFGTNLAYLNYLQKLWSIRIMGSDISDLSPLTNNQKIVFLTITSSNIRNFEPISSLKQLMSLDLSRNEIEDITPLVNCSGLDYADFSRNQIKEIPKWFIEQTHFSYYLNGEFLEGRPHGYLRLYGNPLQSPPPHIVEQGRQAMLDWWERKEKEGTKPLNEVRVMFLGWGNAGKTSVMRRVLGERPRQGEENSTHGINLVNWEVATENSPIKVNLWDFGGQEIQHHTHQFFLAEDCVYVVVINNRENDEPRYWLEYIRNMANDAPTILLFNKADQARNTQHNIAELQRDYPFIKATFEIVAARPTNPLRPEDEVYYEENVAAFCAALHTQIQQHRFVKEQYPKTTFDMKEWVEDETKLGKNYISKKAFRLACEGRGVSESEQKSWLDVFKKIGVITYVKQNLHLDKLLILNPEWATFAVYRIVLHPKTNALQGIITKDDLHELLYQDHTHLEAFRQKYSYEEEDFGSIIELMKEYKLCYSKDNHTLYIPSAFPNNYTSPLEDRTDGLRLQIKFPTFLPPSMVNTLIVELMVQNRIRKSWASGMEVVEHESQTEALVRFRSFEREIHVSVFGERPRELMTLIRNEIKNIKRSFSESLKMNELVPIPKKENAWAKYETLLKLEVKGTTYFQDEDGDEHSVKLLLENIELPQQTQVALKQEITFTHRHAFDFQFNFIQPHISTLLAGLEEIEAQVAADHQWRWELLEAIEELKEWQTTPVASPKSGGVLRRIFEGMKTGKDLAEMLVLPPDFAEKWAKLQASYESIVQILSSYNVG